MVKKGTDSIAESARGKNRGSSAIRNIETPNVEPKQLDVPETAYRRNIDDLYLNEISAAYLNNLKNRIGVNSAHPVPANGNVGVRLLKRIARFLFFPLVKLFSIEAAAKFAQQERFNTEAVLAVQKLIDLNKKSNDLIADKITQTEAKFDALISEIVHKYLVDFTRDLVSRMDILYRRLDESFISHDVEIERIRSNLKQEILNSGNLNREVRDLSATLGAQRRIFEEVVETVGRLPAEKGEIAQKTRNLKDLDYLVFENRFRGDSEVIKQRQARYLPLLKKGDKVLDAACGRGEFLELAKSRQADAEGVDINEEMVKACCDKGLNVERSDVLEFLADKKDSYDVIFCSNLIEHLVYKQLIELIAKMRESLRTGGALIIETINPESLNVFANALYLDLTHIRPIHPLGLEALLESNGFGNMEIQRFTEVSEESKLEEIEPPEDLPHESKLLIASMNRNIARLNNLLFNYQEYGIIAYKK